MAMETGPVGIPGDDGDGAVRDRLDRPMRGPVTFSRLGKPTYWPLVGRRSERAVVAEEIAARRHAGVVIAGRPGVGKTRLAQEALAEAERRRFSTTWIVATRAASSIPFGPFAHLLPQRSAPGTNGLDLFRQIGQVLVERASGRQLVVGVDDAHLLDDASAALVHHLAVRGTAFVAVTLRAGEQAPDSIVALWKDGLAQHLELGALGEPEVAELLPLVLDGHVDAATTAKIWEATLGNPLFLRELVLSGLDSGQLALADGVWSWQGPLAVSMRLRELVALRLEALDADQAALMDLLAHGEPASASTLEQLVPAPALEAAERRGVVTVERDGRRTLVRLAHPLYAEVTRAHCPALRARDVHRQLAAALEATGARRAEDPLRLATFRLESGDPGHPDVLLAGARQALAAFDFKLSERLARAAADNGGGLPALLAVAQSLVDQGRGAEAAEVLDRVDALAPSEPERATAATLRASVAWTGTGRPAVAEQILLTAEEQLEDQALREDLRAMRVFILCLAGQPHAAIEQALPILGDAQASPRARLTVARAAVTAAGLVGRADQAVSLADEWLGPAQSSAGEMPFAVSELRVAQTCALVMAGRVAEAKAVAGEAYREAVARKAEELVGPWASVLGLVSMAEGRMSSAALSLREAVALLRRPSRLNSLPTALMMLGLSLVFTGELDAAATALDEAEVVMPPAMALFRPSLQVTQAWLAAGQGEISKARSLLLDAAAEGEAQGVHTIVVVAIHDLARLGEPRPSRMSELSSLVDGPFAPACALHTAGLAAGDGNRLDAASEAFAAIGMDMLAAEAASSAAAAHRRAGRRGAMLASSARARLHLEACGPVHSPALEALKTPLLTRREREVAVLAGSGMTSPEIAEQLVLSARTVEGHLQRAYAKLGVGNRHALSLVLRRPPAGGRRGGPGRTR